MNVSYIDPIKALYYRLKALVNGHGDTGVARSHTDGKSRRHADNARRPELTAGKTQPDYSVNGPYMFNR